MSVSVADEVEEVPVALLSGAPLLVYPQEVGWLEERVARYKSENRFVNVSDEQDIDRMLVLELLSFRIGSWIARDRNYWGEAIDAGPLQRTLREMSAELRQIKTLLGIDKATREKTKGEDSVVAYLMNLKQRAREFGVMRDKQTAKAIELFQQCSALVTLNTNTTGFPDEQRENHCTAEDIVEWLREVAVPEFVEIDAAFRQNQKTWVRKL